MASGLFRLTHSKVRTFLRCSRQYAYEYVEAPVPRPREPVNPAGVVGKAVHEGMRWLSDTGKPDVGRQKVDAYLRMPGHEIAGHGTEWYALAMECYARGCDAHASIATQETWSEAEKDTDWRPGGIQLYAKIDRVDQLGPDRWQVIDWKTSRYERAEEIDDQLDIAHVVVRARLAHRFSRDATMLAISWNLRTGETRSRELLRSDAVSTLHGLAALADRMRHVEAASAFAPVPGPYCTICRWREHCPEATGTASARLEEYADELGEDEADTEHA